MTFQGYLDTIRATTGLGPDDFVRLAAQRGLAGPDVKAGEVIAWLAADHGLGRGHAMAIVAVIKSSPVATGDRQGLDGVTAVFSGPSRVWWPTYELLWSTVRGLGDDVDAQPTAKYVSFVRGSRKFAIVAATRTRLDVGLKLDPDLSSDRLEAAGMWNSMVTHRAQVTDPNELDQDLLALLAVAYERAGQGAGRR